MSRPRLAGRVIVVGSLNIDHVWSAPSLPRPGETLVADTTKCEFAVKAPTSRPPSRPSRWGAQAAMPRKSDVDAALHPERGLRSD